MLEGLYTLIAESGDKTHPEADVRLDAGHPVVAGHFPGRPVLPGVCQFELVRHLVQRRAGRPLSCRSVRELKFLSPVIPPQDSLLRVELVLTDTGDGGIDVRGAISADGVQKTKIKAIFV